MATPAQIRSAIDADLATVWAAIKTRQATYFANNGRYWQGLRTHSVIPADGTSVPAGQLANKPSYQAEDWTAGAGIATFNKPYALVIDQYNGPSGHGFQATVYVVLGGNTWTRSQDSGTEPYRTQGWAQQQ